MAKINAQLKPECKLAEKIEIAIRRTNILRNIRGTKPSWKWSENTRKLIRKASHRGID
jgi:hypothetical protein